MLATILPETVAGTWVQYPVGEQPMPITYELETDNRLVVFHHVGAVSDDELLASYGDFFVDPKSADYLRFLIMLEKTKSVGRSSQALRLLATLLAEIFERDPGRRMVAVVAPTDHSFGMARMYEVFSERVPWDFRVFREGAAAREWLGLDFIKPSG